ncbi:MAG: glutamate-1-semialdehyde 2,1-aminomutase [Candidatus Alcyoniella australis]|nr:glutamate-1-semialdehyde 2,1-aminomutase [Candidatus Alcyoniella australis]
MRRDSSKKMFDMAQKVLVGGVNSPVRAFRSVGGEPVFFASAKGAVMRDVDGNDYVDYVGSWGPMILGHSRPEVTRALLESVEKGTSFGAPGEMEHLLGALVCERVNSVEKIRFVNSGTEATMGALRLARGFTGRAKAIKFEGCYHGHGDSFLIKAGSGALTFGEPDSSGVTAGVAKDTLTAQFNDLESVMALADNNPGEIAAVIVEPVAGNMGVIGPRPGFLQGLRELCDRDGIVLIFDEVMTGFRVGPGSAQGLFGVTPDLTCMGKVIGGGLPVGAFGGKAEIMDNLSPLGPVYQAGTLSGNPLAMAAGYATLSLLTQDVYDALESYGARLEAGLIERAKNAGVPVAINRVGSMMTMFFTTSRVFDFASAKTTDTARFGAFFNAMLNAGVYLPPSAFEAWFISAAHVDAELEKTLDAAKAAFA